jgi:dipeptidyl aminopeptidase/acylaminoacyl peptidase
VKSLAGLLTCVMLCGVGADGSAASSQGAPQFTLEDLGGLARLSTPALSPDGKWVALIVARPDPAENRVVTTLNLIDTRTGAQRFLVSGELSHLAWSPRSDQLAWLASDSDKTQQIYRFALDSEVGVPIVVTKSVKGAGVQDFAWSPDSESFAYLAEQAPIKPTGNARFDRSFEASNEDYLGTTYLSRTHGPGPARLWLISTRGGSSRLLTTNADHIEQIAWQADGKSIYVIAHAGTTIVAQRFAAISSVNVQDGALTPVVARPANVGSVPMRVSSTGLLAYQHYQGQDPWLYDSNVAVVNGGQARDVTAALDRHIEAFDWLADGSTLLVQGLEHVRRALWTVSLSGAARRLDLHAVNPETGVAVSRNGRLAFIASEPSLAPELYVMASVTAKPVRLTHINSAVNQRQLGKVDVVTWQNDGFDHDGLLTYPPDFRPGQRYPMLVSIHGGPHYSSQLSFNGDSQFYAAQGWLVFEPNYRGGDGQGDRYRTAVINDATAGPGRDLAAGIAAVTTRGLVDEARIALAGWSYGGVMTAWMIGHSQKWCAAIPGALVVDFADYYNQSSTGIWIGSLLGSPYLEGNRKKYEEQSPETYLDQATTPTMILHNAGDDNAPVTQAYALFHALKDRGIKTRLIVFGTDGHEPGDPFHERQVVVRTLAWMQEHCGSSAP